MKDRLIYILISALVITLILFIYKYIPPDYRGYDIYKTNLKDVNDKGSNDDLDFFMNPTNPMSPFCPVNPYFIWDY